MFHHNHFKIQNPINGWKLLLFNCNHFSYTEIIRIACITVCWSVNSPNILQSTIMSWLCDVLLVSSNKWIQMPGHDFQIITHFIKFVWNFNHWWISLEFWFLSNKHYVRADCTHSRNMLYGTYNVKAFFYWEFKLSTPLKSCSDACPSLSMICFMGFTSSCDCQMIERV